MAKLVYLLKNKSQVNFDVDALLIPIKTLSTREMFSLTLEEAVKIKRESNKEVYFLCDRVLFEDEINIVKLMLPIILNEADKVYFSDFLIYEEARKMNLVEKLVYYSPTLALNPLDLRVWVDLGVKNIMISKECEYSGYVDLLDKMQDVNLGMLAFGYPQIYNSHRKMISCFKDEYQIEDLDKSKSLYIKEKSRNQLLPIVEDDYGTYIFAGEVFYPAAYLKEFLDKGMEYFLIDTSFVDEEEKVIEFVKSSLYGDVKKMEHTTTFMMFREMVDNYEKN